MTEIAHRCGHPDSEKVQYRIKDGRLRTRCKACLREGATAKNYREPIPWYFRDLAMKPWAAQ